MMMKSYLTACKMEITRIEIDFSAISRDIIKRVNCISSKMIKRDQNTKTNVAKQNTVTVL